MTGRDRNDRSGMDFDDTTKGFYKSIGIKDDHRALPYEPWSKGQIERFFRTVCNRFTKWFKSYTGTLTGSKTSDKVTKDIKRMCENGELLTMEEFYEEWHKWLTEVYMHTEHGGLKKAKKGFFKFGVETVQFQYYFKEVMAKKSAEEGEYLPIEEIQSSVNKVLRIESLQPLIKNKYIKFNREHKALLKQLQEFPMGKNDDAPDGLQMAVQTAQNVKGAAIKTSYKSIIRRRFRMGKGAY